MSNIAALADLFPKTFTAERWKPHKPLKIGIHTDLIAAGILTPREVRNALAAYTKHRMYLAAVAAGGFRFDLNGNPAGEVTSVEAAHALESLARLDAAAKDMALHAKTALATSKAPIPKPQAKAASIADLRVAAAARRAANADAQRLAS
jgi:ProP effector